MRGVLLCLALSLALTGSLLARPAAAAMCFDFTLEPASPHVGQQVAIDVKSEWTVGLTSLALRVWRPDRSTSVVPLTQVGSEEHWRGAFVFDGAGTWALQAELAVPSNEYPCFYQAVEVVPAPATESQGLGWWSLALATAVGLGTLLLARPSRSRASPAVP